jgi:hypothetical protein
MPRCCFSLIEHFADGQEWQKEEEKKVDGPSIHLCERCCCCRSEYIKDFRDLKKEEVPTETILPFTVMCCGTLVQWNDEVLVPAESVTQSFLPSLDISNFFLPSFSPHSSFFVPSLLTAYPIIPFFFFFPISSYVF